MTTPLTVQQQLEAIIELGDSPRAAETGLAACANLARAALQSLAAPAAGLMWVDDGGRVDREYCATIDERSHAGADLWGYASVEIRTESVEAAKDWAAKAVTALRAVGLLGPSVGALQKAAQRTEVEDPEKWVAMPSANAGDHVWDVLTQSGGRVALVWGNPQSSLETAEERALQIAASHNELRAVAP